MDLSARLKRLGYRAWHRGTREADFMIGGFFDTYSAQWDDDALTWFEALLEQEDVDIMAWAIGTSDVPSTFQGPLMEDMKRLDYISIPR